MPRGSTTLTIGPIEVRNYRAASGETLLRYPTPWHRVDSGGIATFHRDQVDSIQVIADAAGSQGKIRLPRPS